MEMKIGETRRAIDVRTKGHIAKLEKRIRLLEWQVKELNSKRREVDKYAFSK